MDYTLVTTPNGLTAAVDAEDWPDNVKASVLATVPLADLSKGNAVEVSVAVGSGGWAVVRVAAVNREA